MITMMWIALVGTTDKPCIYRVPDVPEKETACVEIGEYAKKIGCLAFECFFKTKNPRGWASDQKIAFKNLVSKIDFFTIEMVITLLPKGSQAKPTKIQGLQTQTSKIPMGFWRKSKQLQLFPPQKSNIDTKKCNFLRDLPFPKFSQTIILGIQPLVFGSVTVGWWMILIRNSCWNLEAMEINHAGSIGLIYLPTWMA